MKTRTDYYSEQIRNEAYAEVLNKLTQRESQVYNCILEFGPISLDGIAKILGGAAHWYSGRVQTLRDDYKIIEFAGKTRNEESNRPAALYVVKKWDPQLAFHF
jgi:hypothetical protein